MFMSVRDINKGYDWNGNKLYVGKCSLKREVTHKSPVSCETQIKAVSAPVQISDPAHSSLSGTLIL